MDNIEFFIERFSRIYPLSHCLWRVPEAAAELKFFPLQPPILDLGCGDGTYAQAIFTRVAEVAPYKKYAPLIGLDPNPKETAKAIKLKIYDKVSTADSFAIPLPDASVNTIFSNSVVEHIKNKDGALREISRVLAPGGAYLFSAPSQNYGSNFRIAEFLSRIGGPRLAKLWISAINGKFKHYWIQSPEEWSEDLARHGLKTLKYRYTLSPRNSSLWELFLLPSYVQHLFAKKFGILPFASITKKYLQKHISELTEDPNMETGGNIVILAQKI
ncbi:class I SAM-dependent methyltransferase [Candidatus Uhrbacteria bacterium]|nr:class I SAM-dependent methyltransferase [Candidatus Uhrbacteria bacterium]